MDSDVPKDTTAENGEGQQPQKPTFVQFFSGLVGEVLIHLGYIENPIAGKKDRNLLLASYTLEIMGMLEEKTKGNLSEDERKYVDSILYDLRMRFVDEQRKAKDAPAPESSQSEESEESDKSGEENSDKKDDIK